jgi:1-acyl-sn-glycerol-3-phosphate acyltransferase
VIVGFYRVVRAIVAGFCRLFWRLSVEGQEHLPVTGAYILAPIHRSNIDFAIAASLTPRPTQYLAKHTLWKYGLGNIWERLGAIAVVRGTPDRSSMKAIDACLAGGRPVVMFPEGTRQDGPLVQPLFDGVAYAALRAGVPIVPVGIGGTAKAMPRGSKILRPVKVVAVIGEPIAVEPPAEGARVARRAIKELTEELSRRIQVHFDDAQAKAGS